MNNRFSKTRLIGNKIFVGLAVYIFFDLLLQISLGVSIGEGAIKYINYLNFRKELSQARILWQENGTSNYKVTITGNKFYGDNNHPCTLANHEIVFEQGIAIAGYNIENCKDLYNEIAIGSFFEQVERELTGINIILTDWSVEFNQEYGYVSFYRVDYHGSILLPDNSRIGIFPQIDYDFKTFGIIAFSPT